MVETSMALTSDIASDQSSSDKSDFHTQREVNTRDRTISKTFYDSGYIPPGTIDDD